MDQTLDSGNEKKNKRQELSLERPLVWGKTDVQTCFQYSDWAIHWDIPSEGHRPGCRLLGGNYAMKDPENETKLEE